MSVLGVHLDEKGETLYVCSSDPAQKHDGRAPELVAFDIQDGTVSSRHPFPEGGLCNDIAELDDGTILVTDSVYPRIMSLDTSGKFGEWLRDEQFRAEGFALNGISVAGSVVYAGVYATGQLFTINTTGSPSAAPVALDRPLAGPDGIEVFGSSLLVAEGQTGTLSLIKLSDDLSSGTVSPVANGFQTPTSVAVDGNKAYVVQGQLGRFFGMDTSPVQPFELAVVPLN